jgi:hypothetical protein
MKLCIKWCANSPSPSSRFLQQNFVKFHFYRTIGSKTVRLSDCRHNEPSDFWGVRLYKCLMYASLIWVIIKIHVLFCYYAIKRQISIKLIGENMFYPKAHQLSMVLPSKSRLVQLRIYTCYTKTCFFLGVTCYFSRITYFWSIVLFRCNDFIQSLYYFWTILKALITHFFSLDIHWNLKRKLA